MHSRDSCHHADDFLCKLNILVSKEGFYTGFSKNFVIESKLPAIALVVLAITFPESAASVPGSLNMPGHL
jgi:hypothetical protein